MKLPRTECLLVAAILLVSSGSGLAQSLNRPNAAERQVFDKVIPIIRNVLDGFSSKDWSLDQDWYNGDPMVPAGYDDHGPIGIDQNFERDYKADPTSERFSRAIKPIVDRAQALSARVVAEYKESEKTAGTAKKSDTTVADAASLDALNKQLTELSELHVYAYINRADVEGSPVTDVHAEGSAMLTEINEGYMINDYFKSYFIAFGDWTHAKRNASDNTYDFTFKDTSAPSVQNIVIVMTGAPDRMTELIQKTDWSVLSKAITDGRP